MTVILMCGGEAQNSPFTLRVEFGINKTPVYAFGAAALWYQKYFLSISKSPRSRFTNRFTTKRTTTHLAIATSTGCLGLIIIKNYVLGPIWGNNAHLTG